MKPLVFISAPVDTYSGYGARSRDIVKALLKTNKYDIKILSQRWGSTPFGFLKEDNEEHKQILECIWKQPQLPKQPDLWIQITVPNEFQPIGKYNIGITAGIETTICSPYWIEGMNRMNMNLVSSEHAKTVFQNSKFEKRNQLGQTEGITELKSPIEVLFEGADTEIYRKLDIIANNELSININSIEEDFAFLFVGHWLQGEFTQDRKNIGGLIKTFLETFTNKVNQPALILKTQNATPSIMDKNDIQEKINAIRNQVKGKLPNIYIIHGELSDIEMNMLYNHPKVKAHVSFTRGEGFGRPLLEASISQKPVIVSNWSGHLDFINPEWSIMLAGKLEQLHPSAVVQDMLLPESSWFTVDYKLAPKHLKDVFENYKNYLEGAKRQAYRSRTEFNLDKMAEKLDSLIDSKIPKPVVLKLPQLKKISLPKLDNIES
jgi:glycosyltransferase involved in cell wall biosynthesis